MAKWGTTTVNINQDNYKRGDMPGDIVEIPLLPAATGTAPGTALQQKGRGRKRYPFEALVKTWAEYEAYQTDSMNKTARTFDDGNVSLSCIIFALGAPIKNNAGHYTFSITLMEA